MERFYGLPMAVRVLITAVVTFGVVFGVLAVQPSHGTWAGSLVAHLVVAAITGLLIAIVMVVTERGLRRDFGSIEQLIVYSRALRTGELPAHIEPDAWRAWLNRSRAINRRALIAPAILVVIGVVPSLIASSGYHSVTGLVFALLVVWTLVAWRLTRGRVSRLATAVEERALATPAG
jgi:hypothetical protein